MSKTKLILVACVCAALVAGLAAGIAWSRLGHKPLPPPRLEDPLGPLNLTQDQRDKMREIWSGVMRGPGQQRGRHEELQKARDAAVVALLDAEQKAKYEELMKAYSEKLTALEAERKSAVEEAVKRTKEILTPEQRVKYEEMLSKQRAGPRRQRGRPGGPGGEGAPPPPPGGPPHRDEPHQ